MKKIAIMLIALVLALGAFASDPTRFTSLGVGTESNTSEATNTIGEGDLYVYDDLEVDGEIDIPHILAVPVKLDNLPSKTTAQVWTQYVSTGLIDGKLGLTTTYANGANTTFMFPTGGVPRSLRCSFDSIFTTNPAFCPVTITGYDQFGTLVSDVIISSVAVFHDGKVAFAEVYSVKLGTVTIPKGQVALTNGCGIGDGSEDGTNRLKLVIGYGEKIGLGYDIKSVANDVVSLQYTVAGAWGTHPNDTTKATLIDATYDTFNVAGIIDASSNDEDLAWTLLVNSLYGK